ncbi:hypothetical protein BHE74_00024628 [Ensete ventricosum]|nr:hypothetical protein BHE74_00024628 [Ensete ventricosum]
MLQCSQFTLEIRQSSSKKASPVPIREMINKEASNAKEIKRPSPNLIARLMGLDSLPSSVRRQKNMDCNCQTSSSIGFSENHAHPEDRSYQRSAIEDQEFKDVFEVTETSKKKKKKHRNYSNNVGVLSHRGYKIDMDLIRQKSMVTEHFSSDEMLQNSRKFNDAVEVPDLRRDLFLELLQDPNSLFAKHLRDLNRSPPSPDQSKIANLRPSKGTKHSSNEVWYKLSRSERNLERCFPMSQEVTGSCTMHMTRLNKHYVEENNGFLSHNLTASHVGKTEADVHPAQIVILKPNLEKSQKMAEANYFPHESFRFCSKRCREIAASGTDELHDESRQRSHHREVICHKIKGSREISRDIRKKLRHTVSHTNKGFTSEMDPYAGSKDSCSFPGFCRLYHSDAICQSPGHFVECCSSISPSSSYSTESSVIREARRRLCERWKLTHEFHNMGLTHDSSTLGEILALSDREVPKVTMEMLDTKKVTEEKLANNEVVGNKDCPLGISSNNGCTDGNSRYLPRSSSLPVSCSPELTDRKRNEGNRKPMAKDVRDMKPYTSDASFTKPGKPPLKPSKHQTHKYMQTYSLGEENMLPEWEIHANSEGLRKSSHLRHFVDKRTLHPSPTDYGNSDRNQLITNASIPILRDEPWCLTAEEEQTMQSAYQESLQNEGSFGHIKNVIVIEVLFWNHSSLVKFSLVVLHVQLQLLKLESVAACTEETDVLMRSDKDSTSDSHKHLPSEEVHQRFIDDDDRDFAYLLDMLIESGIHGVDDKKLVDACYLLGYPVDQNIFSKIEKKYEKIASWSRSERKFLFDLINCTLAGLVTSCMDAHPRVTSKICQPAWDGAGLVEGLWQMVAKHKEEVDCNLENKILESGWFCLEYDVGLIATEMESLLNDDLLEELVGEFVSVRATPELLW